eukprot:715840-Alexandrium_andersonii.AAC.1
MRAFRPAGLLGCAASSTWSFGPVALANALFGAVVVAALGAMSSSASYWPSGSPTCRRFRARDKG